MKSKIFNTIKKHWPIWLFLSFYFLVIAYKLIVKAAPFYDWDESLYIQTGKEMIERNYFLFPVWQGQPWLDKPPLIPLIYGLTAKIFYFIPPEISTRVFTLIIAIIVLVFVYKLYYPIFKEPWLTTLITAFTSFIPIFLQRAQVINLDIFLLLGWLGYFLFYENFWVGLFFLFVAVFSKSLIGFYPLTIFGIYCLYLYLRKKIKVKELLNNYKKILIQGFILLSWFLAMLILFGKSFWQLHIIESHFRRITASIEFHFGARTFYLNLAKEQLGWFIWLAVIGLGIILIRYGKKEDRLLRSLYLLPWFLFLNFTKTKIFWYLYASIPQLAFLSLFPVVLTKKFRIIYFSLITCLFGFIIFNAFSNQKLLNTFYAKKEFYYYQSLYAKNNCSNLHILLNNETRTSFSTLEKMGLLITTTKWWGDHPSIIYYFGKPVTFYYDKNQFINKLKNINKKSCVSFYEQETNIPTDKDGLTYLKEFKPMVLYQKN